MSSSGKKNKKSRDPNRPKRAMTPFLYYACEQRAILKQQGRKMALTEQSRYIAGLWKNISDKTKYIQQSERDKARYREQMAVYEPPYKIKRPRSSYAFFMQDQRDEIAKRFPDKTPRELMANIATVWKEYDDDVKEKYMAMARQDKERYYEEKERLAPTE